MLVGPGKGVNSVLKKQHSSDSLVADASVNIASRLVRSVVLASPSSNTGRALEGGRRGCGHCDRRSRRRKSMPVSTYDVGVHSPHVHTHSGLRLQVRATMAARIAGVLAQ
jgi:hypothetical protein